MKYLYELKNGMRCWKNGVIHNEIYGTVDYRVNIIPLFRHILNVFKIRTKKSAKNLEP